MRKKLNALLASTLLWPLIMAGILIIGIQPALADYAYNSSYLISDKLFTDYGVMNVSDIQTFLNNENSGLKNYTDVEDCGSSGGAHYSYYQTYYHCGSSESAAQIIYDSAQAYQISPRAIMATLQKEQSLITDPSPTQSAINCAMGYNSCSGYSGFFYQVDNGTWDLRIMYEGAQHHTSWNGWTSVGGYSSIDNWYTASCGTANSLISNGLYPGNTVTFYDPGGTAETVTIGDLSTAALYCYTPYVGPYSQTGYSGSYNFVQSFEQWWGSVSSPCYNDYNVSGAVAGEHVLPIKLGINHTDNFTIVQPNNTGTACLEDYTWQNGTFGAWQSLTPSITPAVNPANSSIVSADLNGDGVDELYLVDYNGTGSGRIEVHGWSSSLQGWVSHVATNSPTWSQADAEVIACDPAGYGHDNLFLVEYRGTTSGDIEIHEWSTNLQQWVNHWDTHYSAVDPVNTQIVCGDLSGDGKDAFYLVQYNGTASGRLEIHGGITNLGYYTPWPYSSPAQWPVHTATISGPRTHLESDWAQGSTNNMPAIDSDLIFADTVGNGVDRPYLVQYHGTASGRVEVYQMSNDFKRWVMLTTTNQGAY